MGIRSCELSEPHSEIDLRKSLMGNWYLEVDIHKSIFAQQSSEIDLRITIFANRYLEIDIGKAFWRMADGTILLTVVGNPRTLIPEFGSNSPKCSSKWGSLASGNYSLSHNTNTRPPHLYLVGLQGTNYKPHLMPGSSSFKNLDRLPCNLNPLSSNAVCFQRIWWRAS